MAKTTTIVIDGKTVMVRELTMQEIYDLSSGDENPVESITSLLSACTDIDRKFLMSKAPSEIAPLIEKIIEVNRPFLDQATALDMEGVAKSLERMMRGIFTLAFLPLSEPGMDQEPGTIPTLSS
jgi:hypothetical protein